MGVHMQHSEGCLIERAVVATIWQDIEALMLCSSRSIEQSIWLLMSTLPQLEELDTQQLPELAQLHLSSAARMMSTVRLLAPGAFAAGADAPDEELLEQLDGSLLAMVSCLIELQIFHLQRAALLTAAHSRRRAQGKPACAARSSASATSCRMGATYLASSMTWSSSGGSDKDGKLGGL